MKANGLMIGDWLRTSRGIAKVIAVDKIGLTFKIDGGDFDIDEYDEEKWFDALPLTPEILEKNGFTKDEEIDQWYFKSDDRLDMGLLAVGIDDGCGTGFCVMPNGAVTYYCKYVHELQHYLRLIGGAKEIEL